MTFYKSSVYLLIAALFFAAMPTVSYSASDNRITRLVTVGENEILQGTNAPILVLDLKDPLEPEDTFYLLLDGAEWAVGTGINEISGQILGMPSGEVMPSLEIVKIRSRELQVRVKAADILSGCSIRIPLNAKVTAAQATVTVNNNNTAVSPSTYVFAKTMDSRGSVTAKEMATTTGSGVMARLVIEEPFSQAFSKAIANGKKNKIQIMLQSNEYEFALEMKELGVPKLTGIKGFDTLSGGLQNLRRIDAQTLELTLPDVSAQKYTGGFILSDVPLRAIQKSLTEGTIAAAVEGDLIYPAKVNILKVVDYGIDLTAPDKQQLIAGSSKMIRFTLEEKVKDSLIRERLTSFMLTNGAQVQLNEQKRVDVLVNGIKTAFHPIYENGKPIGFEVPQLPAAVMKYTFELNMNVPVGVQGEIDVRAEGRSLLNALSVPLFDAILPANITISPMQLKLGLKDQKGGKITLSEIGKGQIRQDAILFIKLEDSQIVLNQPPTVQVTAGDIRVGVAKIVTGGVEIPVIRRSNVPSTIEIKDFVVTVNQMVAEGTYEVFVGGTALSDFASAENIDPIKTAGFMIVTKNGPAPIKAQVTFKIGEAAYSINGQKHLMDAPPYIKNGRTMLPIKYVAYALGVSPNDVLWNNLTKTVTIRGEHSVELKIGSTLMKVNGTLKQMAAPPEINNGRTFVPVAEITRALGVDTRWDEVTRMVIFN